jgi:hypothetical protein
MIRLAPPNSLCAGFKRHSDKKRKPEKEKKQKNIDVKKKACQVIYFISRYQQRNLLILQLRKLFIVTTQIVKLPDKSIASICC